MKFTIIAGVNTQALSAQPPFQYFSQLFPNNEVVSAHYALDDNLGLRDLIEKRKEVAKKLQFARLAYENTGRRPTHR